MSFEDQWARCGPWIAAALEHAGGTHTLDDVRAGVEAGAFQFWPGERCAAVTELVVYPRAKAARIFLAGGELDDVLGPMEDAIAAWAKAEGCDRLEFGGRRGWARAAQVKGYGMWSVCMSKEI